MNKNLKTIANVRERERESSNLNTVGVDDSVDPNKQKHINKYMSNIPTSNIQHLTSNVAITLIALVITIIILLILAGVTIGMLNRNGIFDNAKYAKQKYENAQIQENEIFIDYENNIDKYIDNSREETSSSTKLAGVFAGWKEAASWNNAGFTDYVQIDENMCTLNNYQIEIKEGGHYLISMLSSNTGGGGSPKFQLYQNEKLVKEYNNNSTSNNRTKASIEVDLKEGDIFYGKMYGGGSNPTFFVTTFYKLSN